MDEFVLELKGITKLFTGVKALDKVNFTLKPGEIHALMGENGAGKSTFIKIITGVHTADEGEMYIWGEKVQFTHPREAQKFRIAAIYQHTTSYPDLSVMENIFIGHEKIHPNTKRLLWKEMYEEAKEILEDLGSSINPKSEMSSLSVAKQQIVEIAKAISTQAKIIIMDEPTASLTVRESEELYRITERLSSQGVSIIFISHRFEDMYRLASRVTVFRDSSYIGTWNIEEISNEQLIIAMVGREITQVYPNKTNEIGEKLLEVKKLSKLGYFEDISFTLHKGEILGITGLVGAGRTEVFQSIFGITKFDSGTIMLNNQEITINNPRSAMDLGITYLPEDRQLQGLVLDFEINKNISLPVLKNISKNGWLNKKSEMILAKKLTEMVHVKSNSTFDLVSSLSGGNQQKVAVAKLLTSEVSVIILDEPTKGVDVGAKSAIYEIINDLASTGYGIVMISSEMPEILGMSDRIIVMKEGRITTVFDHNNITQEMILEASMGNDEDCKR